MARVIDAYNLKTLYAILDIETTGGQFGEEGITEIAIYRFDGHEVVDRFISLINPGIPIQPFVVKLTGINNAMLQTAPKFHEVAKRIVEITKDSILVAHNALFDFRILRTEFKRLGYDFHVQTLCTVELAQTLIPEQPSYSLGKLVRGLGIPITDRHRAEGDALATLKLFQLLLAKDLEKTIVREFIKSEVEKGIEPKLQDFLDQIPPRTGNYYVYREDGALIYIGRSKNMKKHLNQHFVGSAKISKKIRTEVFNVTFEETGSELIAQLKEFEEIRLNRPVYNRKPRKKSNRTWGMFTDENANGFLRLSLQKLNDDSRELAAFVSIQEGKNAMLRIAADFQLCHSLLGLTIDETMECGKCDGVCRGDIAPEAYNARVLEFIDRLTLDSGSMIIVDRGRTLSERSAVLIENGVFKGYGFFDLNYQISNPGVLKNIIIPMPHYKETLHQISAHLIRNRRVKVISLA